MVNYKTAHLMNYESWINREATLKNVSRADLETEVELTPIKITSDGLFGSARHNAIKSFNAYSRNFDAITDLNEGLVGQFLLGIYDAYRVSGTGIRFKHDLLQINGKQIKLR